MALYIYSIVFDLNNTSSLFFFVFPHRDTILYLLIVHLSNKHHSKHLHNNTNCLSSKKTTSLKPNVFLLFFKKSLVFTLHNIQTQH